jgi:hypothetical protein
MAKKKSISKNEIVNRFTDYVLKHGSYPASVYTFAADLGIKEAEFYSHFGAFESIEIDVFNSFFENTIKLLAKDKSYQNYQAKDKLLSFYFTFFEILTANRSYVQLTLGSKKDFFKKMKVLSGLSQHFKQYVQRLDIPSLDLKLESLEMIQDKALEEIAWNQLLITMKFWLDDTSANFEKTDIFIEKSLNTSFELMKIEPIESLIDFGKFLIKEKLGSKV